MNFIKLLSLDCITINKVLYNIFYIYSLDIFHTLVLRGCVAEFFTLFIAAQRLKL